MVLNNITVAELAAFVVAIGAVVSVIYGAFKWAGSVINARVTESATTITAAIALQIQAINLQMGDMKHKANGTAQKADALERMSTANVERIVKLETNLTNLEKGQERIEHHLEVMKADTEKARAEIIESLRELRNSTLKD